MNTDAKINTQEDAKFVDEIAAVPGGEGIRLCIQCGTCTASCPNATKMQHTPSQLIAMVRAGMRKEVLSSNAVWLCLSCYLCTVRCPRGIRQTDFMHTLAYLSVREGSTHEKTLTPTMYRLFNHYACNLGSLPELWFMSRFYIQTNPFRALRVVLVAFDLFMRGRLSLRRRKLTAEGTNQLHAILKKARALGGAR
jgi:heterodisulfide reductase subunit C